jgi:hypothetical protein
MAGYNRAMKIKPWMPGLAAAVVVAGVFAWVNHPAAPDVPPEPSAAFGSAEIQVPGSGARVRLMDGKASFELAPGSPARGSVELVDGMVSVWKKGERTDTTAILAVNSGGSGTFYYLALYDGAGEAMTKRSEVFLGDRIKVTRIGVGELVNGSADYRLTVQTLVRKENEPFTAQPSVALTRTFYVENQILKEVVPGRDDS